MTLKKQIKIDEAKWNVNTVLWRELKKFHAFTLLQKQGFWLFNYIVATYFNFNVLKNLERNCFNRGQLNFLLLFIIRWNFPLM